MFTKKSLTLLIIRHIFTTLCVVLLAASLVYILSKQIQKISDTIVKNKQLTATLEKRTSLLAKLKTDEQLLGTNNVAIEHAFLSSDNITEFISTLESTALKNGVVQTFRFDSPVLSTISAPFPISTIDYHDGLSVNLVTLTRYLQALENLPYFMKITNLSITSQDPLGIQGVSTVSFNSSLYTKATQ